MGGKAVAAAAGRRFLRMILLLCLAGGAAFFLLSLSPVDPLQTNVGQTALGSMSGEQVERLREYWGAGVPVTERFLSWLSGLLKGDLGVSLLYRRPVIQVVGERFLNSLWLMVFAWVFSGILGLFLGVLAGAFRGRWPDRLVTAYCMTVASTPGFWIALLLLLVFSIQMKLFPIGLSVPIGMEAEFVTLGDRLRHAFLPALTLGLTGVSSIAMHTRAKMEEVMESPYVLYARARGEGEGQIVLRHGLRNVLLPAITLQFASISEIFGGSVLVEQVFTYPGLGQAAVTAGLGSDVPLLLGITLISVFIVFAGNTAADLLCMAADPRVRRGSRERQAREGAVKAGSSDGKTVGAGSPEWEKVKAFACERARRYEEWVSREREEEPEPEAGRAWENREVQEPEEENGLDQKAGFLSGRRGRTLALLAVCGLLLLAVAFFGWLWGEGAVASDFSRKNLPPGGAFFFGTDWLGRDMFLRTLSGLSMSIRLGALTAAASSLIALALAILSATMGKMADGAVSTVIDVVMGIPHMLLLILISYACGKGFQGVAAGIALTHWTSLARVLRIQVMELRESQYVKISEKLGMGKLWIIRHHLVPHLLPQFLTGVILMFPHAILHEASLTFLGFGLPPEEPAVGTILSESMKYLMTGKWWLALFPGLSLTAVVLLFETLGQSLRRLVSPGSAHE